MIVVRPLRVDVLEQVTGCRLKQNISTYMFAYKQYCNIIFLLN